LPTEIKTASPSANSCLLRVSTPLGCRTKRQVSNRFRSSRSSGTCRPFRIPRCGGSAIGCSRNGPNRTENRLERLLSRWSQAAKCGCIDALQQVAQSL
jgi:hypothetical protein